MIAVAVQGDFDDCQRLAKAAFGDRRLRKAVDLTSANSINVGRLFPQMFYYFHAWAAMRTGANEILFSVPSGNLGNLAAGLMAKAVGLRGMRASWPPRTPTTGCRNSFGPGGSHPDPRSSPSPAPWT